MTIRILFLIVISLLVSACGIQIEQSGYIHSDLQGLVTEFENSIGYKVPSNLIVDFTELSGGYVGRCYKYSFGNTILINLDYWNRNGYHARHQLIFHELGHCVLNLGHDDKIDEYGHKLSIMNPMAFGANSYYEDNLQYYIDELIQKLK